MQVGPSQDDYRPRFQPLYCPLEVALKWMHDVCEQRGRHFYHFARSPKKRNMMIATAEMALSTVAKRQCPG